MSRKIKILGVVCMAGLVMSAVLAASVRASGPGTFTTFPEGSTVMATGVQHNGVHKLTLTDHPVGGGGFATLQCTTVHFDGTNNFITSATTITFLATYSGCTAFGLAATVNNNGCHHTLTLTGPTAAGWHVDTTIQCAEGKAITIVTATCEVQIKSQGPLSTVEATNAGSFSPETAMDITLDENKIGIKYSVTKDGIGCPLSGTGSFSKGDYTGSTTITATDSASGAQRGLTIH
jgi:hypothetical protein